MYILQHPDVSICSAVYSFGGKHCDLHLKDLTVSGTLCKLRLSQVCPRIWSFLDKIAVSCWFGGEPWLSQPRYYFLYLRSEPFNVYMQYCTYYFWTWSAWRPCCCSTWVYKQGGFCASEFGENGEEWQSLPYTRGWSHFRNIWKICLCILFN